MEADLTVSGYRGVPLLEPDVEPWPRLGPTAKESGACLRSKPAAVLSEKNVAEGTDWLRLRTQKYLSKKHNLRQNVISDKTVLAPPLPPTPWACTQRPSKASLQHHYRSSLETAAAALC
ncbi:hypothetical protein GJAV_G00030190 [Gymnothorax javanicus]|nr:hypothetical protein GJAV_G00030190 [Gymnothorax javanicus]